MSDALKLVKDLKFAFRESEKEVYIDCPFCSDTRKRMGINKESKSWNCFNCSSRGKSLSTFRKALGKLKKLGRDKIVEFKDTSSVQIKQKLGPALVETIKKETNKFVIDYLIDDRRLSSECIEHFKLGARKKFIYIDKTTKAKKAYDAGMHLAIPYYEGEHLVNIKYRALEPKMDKSGRPMKWRREEGGKTALFNYDVLNDHDFDDIIIAESEIDCMSLWTAGFKNVVGLTAGAQSFKQEWYDLLERYEKVYIVLDNDKAGQEGAEALARRLGMGRCFNVILPEDAKDPNDFFKLYSSEDFKSYMIKGRQFNPKNITNLKSVVRDMVSNIGKRSMQLDGLDTGWKAVNNILGKVGPGNLITIAAKPKVGKCQRSASIVINPKDMTPLTIEQAIKNKMSHIHSYNEETKKIEVCKISDWIDSGVKPLVRVETKIGRAVETTYSHRYLTFEGWKFVKDIVVGEKIAVPTNLEFFGDNVWTLRKIHLIASLIADGSLTSGNCNYSKSDMGLIELMQDSLIAYNCKLKHINKHDYRIVGNNQGENKVRELVKALGIDCLSKHKVIPNEIFSLRKELLAEFIGMLWSHDGSIMEKNGRTSIEYSSASEKLIDGLNHLLIRFGINLRKRYKKAKLGDKYFDSWVLETSQAEVVGKFLDSVPLYGEKAKRSYVISEKMNRDYMTSYPKEMWKVVKSEVEKSGSNMAQLWYSVIGYVPENYTGHRFKIKGGCSKAMLSKINKHLNSELLQSYIDSDISFVEVTSIKDIGEHQCYDLTVPKHENFLCNDIVAHNTTLAMNWLLYLAMKGYSSFNYQCEMEEEDMVTKYGNMVMFDKMPIVPEVEYTEEGDPIFEDGEHKKEFETACSDKRIWLKSAMLKIPVDNLKSFHPKTSDLIDDNDGDALDKVCEKCTEAVQRFGCKVVVFDNLHFLCRGDRAKEQIDKASRRFKLLAKELQIVFILITHPRKTNHNRALTNDDLKDSASIFQDSDAIILLHRPYLDDSLLPSGLEDDDEELDMTQEGSMDSIAEIKVTARRHKGGKTNLYFNDERALFKGEGNDYLDSMREKIKNSKKKNKRN